ncbi:MAG: bifunctional oligoribonuclease/PAP phosphatase NrnA [Oscillospiraceae bacterium]
MNLLNAGQTAAFLRECSDVHILIHRSPDGDCIGSGYALYAVLTAFGVRARVCCADPIPPMYRFLTEGVAFEEFAPQTVIAVDVADLQLLGDLREQYEGKIDLCIDHHISNTGYAAANFWNANASAACEVLYTLLKSMQFPITKQIALCLYTGMATDTGCFKFSNAGADTFAAVADLKRMFDLPYASLNRQLFDVKSKGRMALDARLMQAVQMSADDRIALLYLPYAWMEELGVTANEVDGASNLPLQIAGVEIGILVKEQPEGGYRISMRAGDHADVSVICRHFGGGGHVKAGGCSIAEGTPEAVCKMLMEVSEAMLNA